MFEVGRTTPAVAGLSASERATAPPDPAHWPDRGLDVGPLCGVRAASTLPPPHR